MDNNAFEKYRKGLLWANIMVVGVGLIVAFFGNSIFLEWHNHQSAQLFFESDEYPTQALDLKNWLFGIIGGTIVGFHVLIIMIIQHPFKNKELWSYQALWLSILLWFVIDSGISLYYGAIHNVIFINLVALILIGIPLLMTHKAFVKG